MKKRPKRKSTSTPVIIVSKSGVGVPKIRYCTHLTNITAIVNTMRRGAIIKA